MTDRQAEMERLANARLLREYKLREEAAARPGTSPDLAPFLCGALAGTACTLLWVGLALMVLL